MGRNQSDASSIWPILVQFWYIMACPQEYPTNGTIHSWAMLSWNTNAYFHFLPIQNVVTRFDPLKQTIWHHKTLSTLVQVMAWCLTAPSWSIITSYFHTFAGINLSDIYKQSGTQKININKWMQQINSLWPSDAVWWQIWVNIGSGSGLLPDGTKPLPEPMLTNDQWGVVAFTW